MCVMVMFFFHTDRQLKESKRDRKFLDTSKSVCYELM